MNEISVLLIGDELLSGSIKDENLEYIIHGFGDRGYATREVRMVRDDISEIGSAIKDLCASSDYLISSGGVGPTHDDVTYEGVAEGLQVPLVRDQIMCDFLSARYGSGYTDRVERMARVPEGSEIILEPGQGWPIVRAANVYVLPGLPRALRDKVDRIVRTLPDQGRFFRADIYLKADETDYADWLERVQRASPQLIVGSYPFWGEPDYNAKISFRSRSLELVSVAFEDAQAYVAEQGWLVRAEPVREEKKR